MEFEGEQGPETPGLTSEEKTWAMFAHLGTLSGYVGVPFGWIVGPLIVYLVKKDDSPFVKQHAMEALNFGISYTIYLIVAAVTLIVLVGLLLVPLVAIAGIVYAIMAGVAANAGRSYRYPFIIRFLK